MADDNCWILWCPTALPPPSRAWGSFNPLRHDTETTHSRFNAVTLAQGRQQPTVFARVGDDRVGHIAPGNVVLDMPKIGIGRRWPNYTRVFPSSRRLPPSLVELLVLRHDRIRGIYSAAQSFATNPPSIDRSFRNASLKTEVDPIGWTGIGLS